MKISIIFVFIFNTLFGSFFTVKSEKAELTRKYDIIVYNESLGIQDKGIETEFFANIVGEINNILNKDIGDNWKVDDWEPTGNVWLTFALIGWMNNQFLDKIKLYVENYDNVINDQYRTYIGPGGRYWVDFTSEFRVGNQVQKINLFTNYYTKDQLTSDQEWKVQFAINVKYRKDTISILSSMDDFWITIKDQKTVEDYFLPRLEENMKIMLEDYKKSSTNFNIDRNSIKGDIQYQNEDLAWINIEPIKTLLISFILTLPNMEKLNNVTIFYRNGSFGHWIRYTDKNGKSWSAGSASEYEMPDGTYNIRALSSLEYKY